MNKPSGHQNSVEIIPKQSQVLYLWADQKLTYTELKVIRSLIMPAPHC